MRMSTGSHEPTLSFYGKLKYMAPAHNMPRHMPRTAAGWRRLVSRPEHLKMAVVLVKAHEPFGPRVWQRLLQALGHQAIMRRQTQSLSTLLKAGAEPTDALMLEAASYSETDMATMLLGAGANAQATNPETGSSALHLAALNANWDLMLELVRYGARWSARDMEGKTPWQRLAPQIPPNWTDEMREARESVAFYGELLDDVPLATARRKSRL